jgi:molybdopterin-guanine dinucleotide biosynthesis protein A
MSKNKKHQKHANLLRPHFGHFGRVEWAILGTPCGNIQALSYQLVDLLKDDWLVSYVDADHASGDAAAEQGRDKNNAMGHGAALEYTDKITHHRFETDARLDTYQYRQYFNEMDLVLVNGNHFKARRQIVVIDPKKEDSLRRKLDRLTQVDLILLKEEGLEVYPFLKEHLEGKEVPTLLLSDTEKIKAFLQKELEVARPPLLGLVLAGGKSQRMGQDKGAINYHGKPQREHVAELLSAYCDATFLSVRPDQVGEIDSNFELLPDTFLGLGPFGAIASAFQKFPNHAWLVVACDLPLLDKATIAQLLHGRNTSTIATAFNSPATEFPEPLITIWEPKSYPVLLQFLTQGYSCPRKVLINSNVQLLDVANPDTLMNVNKPEERAQVMARFNIQ